MSVNPRLALAIVFFLVVPACAVAVLYGPVSRSRLERFARRQRLSITPANGHLVIAYLATTRRWRAGGLLVSVLGFNVWLLMRSAFGVNLTVLLVGWFVGALVAEARVLHLAPVGQRQASLEPRRPRAYLGPFSRWVLPGAVVVSTASTVAAAVLALRHGGDLRPAVVWWLGAMTIAGLVWFTQVRVLRRPQPLAEPDVIAADDAVRSRSLHVLAGSGATLVLYCVAAQSGWIWLTVGQPNGQSVALFQSLTLFIPVLGWAIATASWRVRREPGLA